MTKWIFLSLVILSFHTVSGQSIDTNRIHQDPFSGPLLGGRINFQHPQGKLSDALDKLSLEQNIKISYSSNRMKDNFVQSKNYLQVPLAAILDSLLYKTKLSYSVVGSNIVIVEKKQFGKPDSESPLVNDSSDNATEKKILSPVDTSVTQIGIKEEIGCNKNDLKKEISFYKYKYYFTAGINYLNIIPKYRSRSELSWKENLNYTSTVEEAISPELKFGIIFRNFLCGIGIAYEKFSVDGNLSGNSLNNSVKRVSETTNSPGSGNGQGNGQGNSNGNSNGAGKDDDDDDIITITPNKGITAFYFSDIYKVITLPLEFRYQLQKNKLLFNAGVGYKLAITFRESVFNEKLKQYYEELMLEDIYYEQTNKFASLLSIKISGGFLVLPNAVVYANVEYSKALNTFSNNSLYGFYPNSLRIGLSASYLFGKK